mgnify:CR=1 FL=1|jgi:phosphoenolpyruvate phosphomutase / 2-hydroxyethylphosphonate cytidylyltransferase
MKKSVYVGMSEDFLQPGYLNIIKSARELGQVTVGLIIEVTIASYKCLPFMIASIEKKSLKIFSS